jgi:hypothetical protein
LVLFNETPDLPELPGNTSKIDLVSFCATKIPLYKPLAHVSPGTLNTCEREGNKKDPKRLEQFHGKVPLKQFAEQTNPSPGLICYRVTHGRLLK